MTIEEIRKNAPEGATHYLDRLGDIVYYRYPFNFLCRYWDGLGWVIGNRHTFKRKL